MKKVWMSVDFGPFKKTKFDSIEEAIRFVRAEKLTNTMLRLRSVGSVSEWDNF